MGESAGSTLAAALLEAFLSSRLESPSILRSLSPVRSGLCRT